MKTGISLQLNLKNLIHLYSIEIVFLASLTLTLPSIWLMRTDNSFRTSL